MKVMEVIEAIGPLMVLLVPIITGFRRESLGTSIRIGWALVVFAYFSADFLIPELVRQLYGNPAGDAMVPENGGTLPMLLFGWIFPLVLHFVGFILYEIVDVLCGLLSKARRQ